MKEPTAEVSIYQQAEFPLVLKWQAIAFMKTEWAGIFHDNLKFLAEPYPPELTPVHFAIHVGDALISYATVMQQQLTHANTNFTVDCFGNLFTFPPYRGEGYGAKILHAATTYIRQGNADLAGLFCDAALIPFYERVGWEPTRSPTYTGTREDYEVDPSSRLMLFLSPQVQALRRAFDEEPFYIQWSW